MPNCIRLSIDIRVKRATKTSLITPTNRKVADVEGTKTQQHVDRIGLNDKQTRPIITKWMTQPGMSPVYLYPAQDGGQRLEQQREPGRQGKTRTTTHRRDRKTTTKRSGLQQQLPRNAVPAEHDTSRRRKTRKCHPSDRDSQDAPPKPVPVEKNPMPSTAITSPATLFRTVT